MSLSELERLRQQLREKFPQAHAVREEPAVFRGREKVFAAASFPVGAISEVIPAGPGAGLLLLVAGLLGEPEEAPQHPEVVLIDGSDAFDPDSYSPGACSRLLWVRCSSAAVMVRAADLLIRDGNVPFVLLETLGLPGREISALPSAVWWRMQQAAERTGCRVLVMSPEARVPCAKMRLSLSADLTLQDLDLPRAELLARLHPVSENLRRAH